jgi:hypothetical protein
MIDTSPAALRKLVDEWLRPFQSNHPAIPVLLAIAAEKEAQQPTDDQLKLLNYAWRCLEEEAEECDRRGNALVATRVRESANALGNLLMVQHHPERPLEMVAPADEPSGVLFLEDTFSTAETKPLSGYLASQSIIGGAKPKPAQADVPLPEPDVDGTVQHPELKICYTAPVHYTAEKMRQYAEAYAKAAVAAERELILDRIDECPGLTLEQDSWLSRMVRANQKGTT